MDSDRVLVLVGPKPYFCPFLGSKWGEVDTSPLGNRNKVGRGPYLGSEIGPEVGTRWGDGTRFGDGTRSEVGTRLS